MRVRNRFTVHVSPCCWRWFVCCGCWFCVWFVFCWFGCLLAVVGSLVFACAPYPPSYTSYENSSHSENGHLTFFWDAVPLVLFVYSLVKHCQYPRDPMQPAIKKKKSISLASCKTCTASEVWSQQAGWTGCWLFNGFFGSVLLGSSPGRSALQSAE